MNFKAASGELEPIDNSLAGDEANGWTNKAGAVAVRLPSDLAAQPITVSRGKLSVSYTIEGAKGQAAVDGETATYHDALPGVDVAVRATGDGAKETLALSSAASTASVRFHLTASPGTKIVEDRGELVVTGPDESMRIQAPWAQDAGPDLNAGFGAVAQELTVTEQGWDLQYSVDRGYLSAPERVFPVLVDPTFTASGSTMGDCHIVSAPYDNTEFCTSFAGEVGKSPNPYTERP